MKDVGRSTPPPEVQPVTEQQPPSPAPPSSPATGGGPEPPLPANLTDAVFQAISSLAASPVVRDLAAVIALAVPLLPAIGCMARVIALQSLGAEGEFAVREPIGDLFLTGAAVFLYPAYGYLIYFVSAPVWRKIAAVTKTQFVEKVWRAWTPIVLLGLAAAAFILFAVDWPAVMLLNVPTIFVYVTMWGMFRRGGHPSVRSVVGVLLITGMLAAMASGFTARVPGILAVGAHLTSQADVASGEYVLLGEDDSTVVLKPCGIGGTAHILSRSVVISLTESPDSSLGSHASSLLSILTGHGTAEFVHSPC